VYDFTCICDPAPDSKAANSNSDQVGMSAAAEAGASSSSSSSATSSGAKTQDNLYSIDDAKVSPSFNHDRVMNFTSESLSYVRVALTFISIDMSMPPS